MTIEAKTSNADVSAMLQVWFREKLLQHHASHTAFIIQIHMGC